MDNNVTILETENNIGSIQVADDVVAMIASLAATEIEGVSAMVGNITNELMSKVGMSKLTKGVKVDVLDNVATVDLTIILEYGFNIPETCQKVQTRVKTAIENMTGLTVSDVNIRISSVKVQ